MNETIFYMHGLYINSFIKLEDCPTFNHVNPDVNIIEGNYNNQDSEILNYIRYKYLDLQTLSVTVKNVGEFLIKSSNEIVVNCKKELLNSSLIQILIFNTLIPLLLLQRGAIIMHGSTVELDNKCILFIGESGMGKSTKAMDFILNKGYNLVSDDISVINYSDFNFYVSPSKSILRLNEDMLLKFKITEYKKCSYSKKYNISINKKSRYNSQLEHIFILEDNNYNTPTNIDNFFLLLKNIYKINKYTVFLKYILNINLLTKMCERIPITILNKDENSKIYL